MIFLLFSGILIQYEYNIAGYKVFNAAFTETIFSQGDTALFEGNITVSRDGFFVNIKKPKREMIFGKDTVVIYLPDEAKAYQMPFTIPLIGAIFSPLSIFRVVKEQKNFANLLYQKGEDSLFVKIKFNKKKMPVFISYNSDVSSIHFQFKKIKLHSRNIRYFPELPDSVKVKKISSD